MHTKICRTCKLEKDISMFYKTKNPSKDGHINQCISCTCILQAEYHKNNKTRFRAYHSEYNRYRAHRVTKDDYEAMLSRQNGVCAICGKSEIRTNKRSLSVDHDHKTGTVRGLLCASCNTALGYAGDDPDILESMARYLRAHNESLIASSYQ